MCVFNKIAHMLATYASVAKCNALRAVDPGIGAGSCWDFARNKKLDSGRKLNDPSRASTTTSPTFARQRHIIKNGPPNVARRATPATPSPFQKQNKLFVNVLSTRCARGCVCNLWWATHLLPGIVGNNGASFGRSSGLCFHLFPLGGSFASRHNW